MTSAVPVPPPIAPAGPSLTDATRLFQPLPAAAPDVEAETIVLIAAGLIRPDEARVARFLIESRKRLDALGGAL